LNDIIAIINITTYLKINRFLSGEDSMNRFEAPLSPSRRNSVERVADKNDPSGASPISPPHTSGELRLLLSGTPLWTLLHERMASELLHGRSLVLICGDNGLSTDFLVRKAKNAGQSPELLLSRLRVSRAFTVHQLLAAVTRHLEAEMGRSGASMAVISGLLPLFSEAAIPCRESGRILGALVRSLESLSRKNLRILLPVALPLPISRQAKSVISGLFRAASQVETVLCLPSPSFPSGD
jgi:hypothetical protein